MRLSLVNSWCILYAAKHGACRIGAPDEDLCDAEKQKQKEPKQKKNLTKNQPEI